MKILLTGGTGLIGRHLIARLQALHHDITVVTRSPEKARQVLGAGIDIWKNLAEQQNLDGFDAVINLAGEPIADKRWTEEQKQLLCSSRWNITEKLVELIRNSHTPPSVLISGSAVGYYGDLGEVVVTEEEPPHNELTHKLCAQWERIACAAQSDRTRVPAADRRRAGAERRHSGEDATPFPARARRPHRQWSSVPGVDPYRRYGQRYSLAAG